MSTTGVRQFRLRPTQVPHGEGQQGTARVQVVDIDPQPTILSQGHRLVGQPVGLDEAMLGHQDPGRVHQGTAFRVIVAEFACRPSHAEQQGHGGVDVGGTGGDQRRRGADVDPGLHERLGVSQRLGDLGRPAGQAERLVAPLREDGELRLVAERHRQFPAGRERAEDVDGFAPGGLGAAGVAGGAAHPGEPSQGVGRAARIAELPAKREGTFARLHRDRDPPGGERLGGERVPGVGTLGRRDQILVLEHLLEEVGGLPVRSRGRRGVGGAQPVPHQRRGVSRPPGVMGDPRVGGGRGDQGAEHGGIVLAPVLAGERLLDDAPGQLVPEPDAGAIGDQQPQRLAGLHVGRRPEAVLDQPELRASGHHADQLRRRAPGRQEPAESPEHRIPDAGGGVATVSGEQLGDQEGVATGEPVHRLGVDSRAGEAAHGVQAQRRQADPPAVGGRRGGEGAPQRMPGGQLVVAEGEQQQQRSLDYPAGEVAEHVQGRLIGPVHVLDDADRRFAAQHLVRLATGVPRRVQDVPPHAIEQFEHRSQRTWRQQVVAAAAERPQAGRERVEKVLHQARLADPGLAVDEHHPASAGGERVHGRAEFTARTGALQQRHHSMVAPDA